MTGNAIERYRTRLTRVLEHIDEHLDDEFTLDVLGERRSVLAVFHFHRQFVAAFAGHRAPLRPARAIEAGVLPARLPARGRR